MDSSCTALYYTNLTQSDGVRVKIICEQEREKNKKLVTWATGHLSKDSTVMHHIIIEVRKNAK